MQFGRESFTFSSRWSLGRMQVVNLLILINVATFLIQCVADRIAPGVPDAIFGLSREGILAGYYWQFLSYMFLHGGILHLIINCVGLYFAGREVETICGPRHLLGIYFLGGLIGGILQMLASPLPVIGASAGVCAIVLAFTTMLPELEITALLFFIIPVRMQAKWLGRAVILSSILFYLIGFGRDVGHIAHLGGALTGLFYARRIGFGGAFWFQRFWWDRRTLEQRREQMNPSQFISEEIDPILDKISREGIHSLTRAERRILELGRDKIARKTTPPPR